jgi:hypothetical protein
VGRAQLKGGSGKKFERAPDYFQQGIKGVCFEKNIINLFYFAPADV